MELTKVDAHIKAMMLRTPGLFGSRMAALAHLFLTNGNGYWWDEAGCLQPPREFEPRETMDNRDLDERQSELDAEREADTSGVLDTLYASRAAALKREYAVRALIEADIELYATKHVMDEDRRLGIVQIEHFAPRWCVMEDAPYERLDPEWAQAAEEAMLVVSSAIFRHLAMYSERFSAETADPRWMRIYHGVGEILEKLDPITGRSAQQAHEKAFTEKLIAEIAAED